MKKKTYKIDVDCANCANLMEDAARKTEGVAEATVNFMLQKTVNFMLQKMIIKFEENYDPEQVMQQVVKACKKVEPDCEIHVK